MKGYLTKEKAQIKLSHNLYSKDRKIYFLNDWQTKTGCNEI
jgi:hypothetical protein